MFSEAVGLLEQVGFKPSPKLSSTYQSDWWFANLNFSLSSKIFRFKLTGISVTNKPVEPINQVGHITMKMVM